MALVFKHHTRYSKRLYNGLKKIDDIVVPEISHSDEVDGGGIDSEYISEAIKKLRPLDESVKKPSDVVDHSVSNHSSDSDQNNDSEDGGVIEKCDASYDDSNEDTSESDGDGIEKDHTLVKRKLSSSDEAISEDSKTHVPSRLPPTEKKKWPQKPCVVCRRYGTRHDTRYYCRMCNKALCKSPCFKEYHSS